MRSLFLKIFLWFWATVIVTGIALIVTLVIEPRSLPPRMNVAPGGDTARHSGTMAVQTVEREGIGSASAYLQRLARETHMASCLFDSAGKALAGTRCEGFLDIASHVTSSHEPDYSMKYGIARAAVPVPGQNGRQYVFATELPAGPRAALRMNRRAIFLEWGVALLVSGLICSLLTRYLTTPILRLQEMSQRLTAGDLSVRAGAGLAERRDEFGKLVRDFNAMASRIEELISRQRQLTSDVSHELRSPLARLNVALDLGRQRKGDDPAFDQMEADIALLDEMVGRLLTIAKLDTGAPQAAMAEVDLPDLLSQIVRDAEFESRESDRSISLNASGQCVVWGSAELLRSAIENVVRNAIRYTEPGTSVEVYMVCEHERGKPTVRVSVRDHGPGVPEPELKNIFQPFYRVATARDRESGGTGLGLAIAERVIRIHGGTIRAENAQPGGLRVEIVLPQSSGVAADQH